MKNAILKPLMRSIKNSMGRYLAILAICALGVGFYAGIKNSEPAMVHTADVYTSQHRLFDFQLISTLGFTDEDVTAFSDIEGISVSEGAYVQDVYADTEDGEELILTLSTITEDVNTLELTGGRMPEGSDECVADAWFFTADDIGRVITVSEENGEDVTDSLENTELEIVGLVNSPVYLNSQRGSTSIGDGSIDALIFIPKEAYTGDVFTRIWLRMDGEYELYSDEYYENADEAEAMAEAALTERAELRYEELTDELSAYYGDMAAEYVEKPSTFLLTRDENSGLVTFKSDAAIVDSIADAFPVFFVLIAALVCMTTMTRMVNDERTQIGTLKAMGYSGGKISAKYVLYSGTAALLGCVIGFMAGTWSIPEVIWQAFNINYGFSELSYNFNYSMLYFCILVTLALSTGVTYAACGKELLSMPAYLIRPKAPKKGKKVWLEYIKPFWKRLSFLSKVSARNVFRYKRRMFMMIIGIGGCTALLLTGFGINDSVSDVTTYQYEEIMKYDLNVSLGEELSQEDRVRMEEICGEGAVYAYVHRSTVQMEVNDSLDDVTMVAAEADEISSVTDLHNDEGEVAYPGADEAVICKKLSEDYDISVGDTIYIVHDADRIPLTVSGICDNYVGVYVYTSEDILNDGFEKNTMLIRVADETDASKAAAELRGTDFVSSVQETADEKEQMETSMTSMIYIIAVIITAAAALAFIVLFNLTNINIMERVREIATVKVLGFYPRETSSYVLRENIVLSAFGAAAGLVLGKFLHIFIMSRVNTDELSFDVRISVMSYIISFILTLIFALIVNLFMNIRLERVNMSESLKTIE